MIAPQYSMKFGKGENEIGTSRIFIGLHALHLVLVLPELTVAALLHKHVSTIVLLDIHQVVEETASGQENHVLQALIYPQLCSLTSTNAV